MLAFSELEASSGAFKRGLHLLRFMHRFVYTPKTPANSSVSGSRSDGEDSTVSILSGAKGDALLTTRYGAPHTPDTINFNPITRRAHAATNRRDFRSAPILMEAVPSPNSGHPTRGPSRDRRQQIVRCPCRLPRSTCSNGGRNPDRPTTGHCERGPCRWTSEAAG